MPDGSITFAAPMDGASAPAPITITALGYHLAALKAHEDKVDHVQFCSDATDRCKKRAQAAWMSFYDEVIAIEDLILAGQARTLTDAAVQVMMATARLATLNCTELDQEQPNIELVRARVKAVERALWSVTKVCAPVAGLRLADVAGDSYVPAYLDPRPDIDVSGVSDADLGERFACDGTVPAVEA